MLEAKGRAEALEQWGHTAVTSRRKAFPEVFLGTVSCRKLSSAHGGLCGPLALLCLSWQFRVQVLDPRTCLGLDPAVPVRAALRNEF